MRQPSKGSNPIHQGSAINTEVLNTALHSAFEEIERRWGIDVGCVNIASRPYPDISAWTEEPTSTTSETSLWQTICRKLMGGQP